MQFTKIFLGFIITTTVSSLTTPLSRSTSLVERQSAFTVADFPTVLASVKKKCDKEASSAQNDRSQREKWTKCFVEGFGAELSPDLDSKVNAIVICNVDYKFDGTPMWKSSVKDEIVGNGGHGNGGISYDVVVFTVGTFTRIGDGGFQNWAARSSDKHCTSPTENSIKCTA